MTTDEIYQFFGSANKAAQAIGLTRSAFSVWVKLGRIPFKQQQKFESITKGKLTAKKEDSIRVSKNKSIQVNYFPLFRYYDPRYGMCEVESIQFRKGKSPKTTCYIPFHKNRGKFCTFNNQALMQAVGVLDSEGNILYEGDICLLANRKKVTFNKIDMYYKIKNLGKFRIIGNIFEKK